MKAEQSALFDLNQYQAKQSNLGDWSFDVAGDDDEAWGIRTDTTDAIADCGSCTHFDSGQRFCEKFAVRFKPEDSLLNQSDCDRHLPQLPTENDSVSPILPIDTESKTLDVGDGDSVSPLYIEKNDSVATGSVARYFPKGTARGDVGYYRYSYRDGNKMRHIHIPGGNTANPIARQRVEIIQCAINEGRSHTDIQQLISNWQRKRSNI